MLVDPAMSKSPVFYPGFVCFLQMNDFPSEIFRAKFCEICTIIREENLKAAFQIKETWQRGPTTLYHRGFMICKSAMDFAVKICQCQKIVLCFSGFSLHASQLLLTAVMSSPPEQSWGIFPFPLQLYMLLTISLRLNSGVKHTHTHTLPQTPQ